MSSAVIVQHCGKILVVIPTHPRRAGSIREEKGMAQGAGTQFNATKHQYYRLQSCFFVCVALYFVPHLGKLQKPRKLTQHNLFALIWRHF